MTRAQAFAIVVRHRDATLTTRLDLASLLLDLDAGSCGYMLGLRDALLGDLTHDDNERLN